MYSPGSLNVADVAALPPTSFSSGEENCTAPGPRNLVQNTVRPTGAPRRAGRPSSVAETTNDAPVTDGFGATSTLTTGGRFELTFSLLPPRVVRSRSICHTGFSVAITCSVLPRVVNFHTSCLSANSFGTTTLNTSLWRRVV